MHHLAPAPLVARRGEPPPPVLDGVVERLACFVLRIGTRRVVLGHPLEDERRALARTQRDLTGHARLGGGQRRRRLERQGHARRAKHHPVLVKDDDVGITAVLEAGLDLDPELQLPANADDAPDEPVPINVSQRLVDRHEVLHLAHPGLGQKAGDEDIRVGEVELLRRPALGRRGDAVVAAALAVQDGPEHARRVEMGAAVPVDGPVGAHERRCMQVPDDPVLGDREVARERGARARRRRRLRHVPHAHAVLSLRASMRSIRYRTTG